MEACANRETVGDMEEDARVDVGTDSEDKGEDRETEVLDRL